MRVHAHDMSFSVKDVRCFSPERLYVAVQQNLYYMDPGSGDRCQETHALEVDNLVALALGGVDSPVSIEMRKFMV